MLNFILGIVTGFILTMVFAVIICILGLPPTYKPRKDKSNDN